MPRHRIWPILPGVRSFLNYYHVSALDVMPGAVSTRSAPSQVYPSHSRQPAELPCHVRGVEGVDGRTIARSGMKRSPRTSTNLEVILDDDGGVLACRSLLNFKLNGYLDSTCSQLQPAEVRLRLCGRCPELSFQLPISQEMSMRVRRRGRDVVSVSRGFHLAS